MKRKSFKGILISLLVLTCCTFGFVHAAVAAVGDITTVAGTGEAGFSGDGGLATNAKLNNPTGVFVDGAGNLYIADTFNHRVRKVDAAGNISTVAGNGTGGFSGDGGPATEASLANPVGVFVDSSGNLYIADVGNRRIRKVDPSGIITTVAGGGIRGLGDGGLATEASLNLFANAFVADIFVDNSGNLQISDRGNNRIRKVDQSGIITTVVGNGKWDFSGDGGSATEASMRQPAGIFIDGSGNLYIADRDNARIRKVDSSGIITTIAGNGNAFGPLGDGGPALDASLFNPVSVFVDRDENLFIAVNDRIRKVDTSGIITTVAGGGTAPAGDGVPATNVRLNDASDIFVDRAGNLYIADMRNNRIRRVGGVAAPTTLGEEQPPSDSTPPTIASTIPKDGDKDIDPSTINQAGIVITFDEAIDTAKIQISVKTDDQALTWQPAWSDDNQTLTLTPTAGNELGFEAVYTVTLSQVTDTAGNTAEFVITFVTQAAPTEVRLSTLRAAYLFDEGSGTTALDQTGAFNGTIVGATYSTNAPHGEAGNFSLLFDGNARVELGPSSNFAFSSISVELFVNPTAIKGGQRSGFNRANYALAIGQGSSNVGLLLGIDGDGQSGQVGDGTNTSYFDLFNPTPPIPLNAWTHLALTFDGSTNTGRLYVNGSLVASVQQKAITYNENLPARIGALSDRFPGAAWVGFIDEVKIYEGVRTEEEIASSARGVPKPLSLSFPLSLKKGLNMISLPLEPQTPFTAKSLATALGATVVIRHDTDQGRFIPYIPTLAERTGGQGFPIEGGMGYIVNVLEDKEFAFTGQPWGEPVFQAPPIAERNTDVSRSVWAFVVSGLLSRTGSLPVQSMPASVQVTNLRSGVTVRTTPEGEVFQVALVDLNRAPVVLPGDTLEVVALDANGERVSGPFRLEVQTPHLRVAYLHTQMRIGDVIPEQTRLLANYPNPFNPETWVPYELAEAADVTLEIYNLSGRLVRRLHVGQKPAGVYTDRSRAIHWDGRNDIGERVTSGLYFYHFHAGEYEAVRRMVILK